jgi:hypothetical protein
VCGGAHGAEIDTDTLDFFTVPLAGPAVWRLPDDPPGTPVVAWGEVPRHQLRGQATHYTFCIQSRGLSTVCRNGELHASSSSLCPRRATSHPPCPYIPSFWELYVTEFPEDSNNLDNH